MNHMIELKFELHHQNIRNPNANQVNECLCKSMV